jgi:hypothetical protein
MSAYVARQPTRRMSHIASGTRRLMPAIDAAPRTESAVARRRMNQRETTAEPTTWPVVERPRATRTP